ncbi:MAG: protease modulator HflK [Sphingomonas sp.]|uniref:protease modulator HflK n=1 Tax=Sphingomonas sp. TaxID=28214 RepID=UPI001ACF7E3A|nr:protease modulator HflK [Sphingomonas sp.]MBN8814003.1 protease modulator HflK [Sphingomonas sp.]
MTTVRAWWRHLPVFMAKPKSPWGGGGDGPSDNNDDSGDAPDESGAGPRNPWAQPPGGKPRSARASSLDELLKRARSGGGGGNGGGGGFKLPTGGASSRNLWLGGAGLVLVAWIALTSFHVIGPQERGVVTYFGKYSGTLSPGWQTTLPAPISSVQVIDVNSIRTIQFPENGGPNLVLTEDQYLVDLSYTVRWRIADPQKYAFELKLPDDSVKAAAESAVRAVVANSSLDEVLGRGKGQIETQVTQAMQRILDEYQSGITIVGVSLNNASAPSAALDAFNQVTVAQQEYAKNVNAARAYAQSLVASAEGEAQSFDRVYAQYKLAPEVTRRRMYYETMEQVLGQTNKTIIEPRGVAPYLPIPPGRTLPSAPQGGQ